MNNLICLILFLINIIFNGSALAKVLQGGLAKSNVVYVKPHYNKRGKYIEGYYRTYPNKSKKDNFSAQGNVNPFTGKKGNL